jgi:hypothetical protein
VHVQGNTHVQGGAELLTDCYFFMWQNKSARMCRTVNRPLLLDLARLMPML